MGEGGEKSNDGRAGLQLSCQSVLMRPRGASDLEREILLLRSCQSVAQRRRKRSCDILTQHAKFTGCGSESRVFLTPLVWLLNSPNYNLTVDEMTLKSKLFSHNDDSMEDVSKFSICCVELYSVFQHLVLWFTLFSHAPHFQLLFF